MTDRFDPSKDVEEGEKPHPFQTHTAVIISEMIAAGLLLWLVNHFQVYDWLFNLLWN